MILKDGRRKVNNSDDNISGKVWAYDWNTIVNIFARIKDIAGDKDIVSAMSKIVTASLKSDDGSTISINGKDPLIIYTPTIENVGAVNVDNGGILTPLVTETGNAIVSGTFKVGVPYLIYYSEYDNSYTYMDALNSEVTGNLPVSDLRAIIDGVGYILSPTNIVDGNGHLFSDYVVGAEVTYSTYLGTFTTILGNISEDSYISSTMVGDTCQIECVDVMHIKYIRYSLDGTIVGDGSFKATSSNISTSTYMQSVNFNDSDFNTLPDGDGDGFKDGDLHIAKTTEGIRLEFLGDGSLQLGDDDTTSLIDDVSTYDTDTGFDTVSELIDALTEPVDTGIPKGGDVEYDVLVADPVELNEAVNKQTLDALGIEPGDKYIEKFLGKTGQEWKNVGADPRTEIIPNIPDATYDDTYSKEMYTLLLGYGSPIPTSSTFGVSPDISGDIIGNRKQATMLPDTYGSGHIKVNFNGVTEDTELYSEIHDIEHGDEEYVGTGYSVGLGNATMNLGKGGSVAAPTHTGELPIELIGYDNVLDTSLILPDTNAGSVHSSITPINNGITHSNENRYRISCYSRNESVCFDSDNIKNGVSFGSEMKLMVDTTIIKIVTDSELGRTIFLTADNQLFMDGKDVIDGPVLLTMDKVHTFDAGSARPEQVIYQTTDGIIKMDRDRYFLNISSDTAYLSVSDVRYDAVYTEAKIATDTLDTRELFLAQNMSYAYVRGYAVQMCFLTPDNGGVQDEYVYNSYAKWKLSGAKYMISALDTNDGFLAWYSYPFKDGLYFGEITDDSVYEDSGLGKYTLPDGTFYNMFAGNYNFIFEADFGDGLDTIFIGRDYYKLIGDDYTAQFSFADNATIDTPQYTHANYKVSYDNKNISFTYLDEGYLVTRNGGYSSESDKEFYMFYPRDSADKINDDVARYLHTHEGNKVLFTDNSLEIESYQLDDRYVRPTISRLVNAVVDDVTKLPIHDDFQYMVPCKNVGEFETVYYNAGGRTFATTIVNDAVCHITGKSGNGIPVKLNVIPNGNIHTMHTIKTPAKITDYNELIETPQLHNPHIFTTIRGQIAIKGVTKVDGTIDEQYTHTFNMDVFKHGSIGKNVQGYVDVDGVARVRLAGIEESFKEYELRDGDGALLSDKIISIPRLAAGDNVLFGIGEFGRVYYIGTFGSNVSTSCWILTPFDSNLVISTVVGSDTDIILIGNSLTSQTVNLYSYNNTFGMNSNTSVPGLTKYELIPVKDNISNDGYVITRYLARDYPNGRGIFTKNGIVEEKYSDCKTIIKYDDTLSGVFYYGSSMPYYFTGRDSNHILPTDSTQTEDTYTDYLRFVNEDGDTVDVTKLYMIGDKGFVYAGGWYAIGGWEDGFVPDFVKYGDPKPIDFTINRIGQIGGTVYISINGSDYLPYGDTILSETNKPYQYDAITTDFGVYKLTDAGAYKLPGDIILNDSGMTAELSTAVYEDTTLVVNGSTTLARNGSVLDSNIVDLPDHYTLPDVQLDNGDVSRYLHKVSPLVVELGKGPFSIDCFGDSGIPYIDATLIYLNKVAIMTEHSIYIYDLGDGYSLAYALPISGKPLSIRGADNADVLFITTSTHSGYYDFENKECVGLGLTSDCESDGHYEWAVNTDSISATYTKAKYISGYTYK